MNGGGMLVTPQPTHRCLQVFKKAAQEVAKFTVHSDMITRNNLFFVSAGGVPTEVLKEDEEKFGQNCPKKNFFCPKHNVIFCAKPYFVRV
jgi:hypothetical protein